MPITSNRDEFTGEELYDLREEQYFLPPIDLNDEELAALQTSLHLLEGQFAYAEPLRLALQNLALGRANPLLDPGPKTATRRSSWAAATRPRSPSAWPSSSRRSPSSARSSSAYWTIASDTARPQRRVNPYGLWEMNSVWYMVGDDLERPVEDPERRRTFRVSRMRGEIKFATRRERDFRIAGGLQRHRLPRPGAVDAGPRDRRARRRWRCRPTRRSGSTAGCSAGTARSRSTTTAAPGSPTAYSDIGRALGLDPVARRAGDAADAARAGAAGGEPTSSASVRPTRSGRPRSHWSAPSRTRTAPDAEVADRAPSPVAPERFALLQALLAFLLARCGDEPSATSRPPDSASASGSRQQELQEHLDLLNLVNFGGGCYAVYCSTENGSVHRRQGAVRRHLPPPGPAVAAGGEGAPARAGRGGAAGRGRGAHVARRGARQGARPRSGDFPLADTPAPQHAVAEESAVTVLNEGVRDRRLVDITLPLAVVQRPLHADDRAVPAAPRRGRLVRRGVRPQQGWPAHVQGRLHRATPSCIGERYEPRPEMAGSRPAPGRRGRHRPASASPPPARAGSWRADGDRADGRRRRRGRHHLRLAATGWCPRSFATAARPRCSSRRALREAVRDAAAEAARGRRPSPQPAPAADVRQRHPGVALQVAAVAVGDVEAAVAARRVAPARPPASRQAAGRRPRRRPARAPPRRRSAPRFHGTDVLADVAAVDAVLERLGVRQLAPAATGRGRRGSAGRRAPPRRRSRPSGRRRCRPGTSRRRPRPGRPGRRGSARARRR